MSIFLSSLGVDESRWHQLTLFLGCACDGVLEGFAAGTVSSTHATLVLLLGGAHHTVAAHLLLPPERGGRAKEVWQRFV